MAEQDQRTEQATPRKKQKLRDEGRVPQSADVGTTVVLICCALAMSYAMERFAFQIGAFSTRVFRLEHFDRPFMFLSATIPILGGILTPVLAAAAFGAIAATMTQTRGLFTLSSAAPKWERLDPTENIKRVLPGKDVAIEIGKQFLKLGLVGFVVYRVIKNAFPELSVLSAAAPIHSGIQVAALAGKVALHGGVAFAIVAAIDYLIAYRRFEEEAKMSKQEVRDEHREEEGDPQVKRKIRRQMREVGKRRAVTDVKNATVLVTNPTHYSVALRYVPEKGDPAPIVLAKGSDEVALQMRETARRHGIPIVENKPLARALHATGKIGRPIPLELYKAAAEVIAHVLRLKAGGLA